MQFNTILLRWMWNSSLLASDEVLYLIWQLNWGAHFWRKTCKVLIKNLSGLGKNCLTRKHKYPADNDPIFITCSCWMCASIFLLFSPLDCRGLVSLSHRDFLHKRINSSACEDVAKGGILLVFSRRQHFKFDKMETTPGRDSYLKWKYEEIPLLALTRFPPFWPLSSSHRPSSLELEPIVPLSLWWNL